MPPCRRYVQVALDLTLPGQYDKVFPAVSPQTLPVTPVGMARALVRSRRASTHRTALRSMGSVEKVGIELRHRGPLGAADHADPSSTVGSSPGVAKKRMPGIFSLRTSDGTMSSSIALGATTEVGHLGHSALPIHSRMKHRTHSCEAGAIRLHASSCAATQDAGSGTLPAEALLKPLRAFYARSYLNFGGSPFHALR